MKSNPSMKYTNLLVLLGAVSFPLAACGTEAHPHPHPEEGADAEHASADDHDHDADDHDHDADDHDDGDDHHGTDDHVEVPLGTVTVGDMRVELAQGHGAVAAGTEGHLVVKLPYSDAGATVVRAWIGTEDRTASLVAKATYAASHDDYDVHAVAPDPLPDGVLWWFELEKPDGTKLVGSATPLFE